MEKSITALEPQKNNPRRVNVYLDHEFAFGLSRIVAAWLQVGEKLNAEKIQELIRRDEYEKALQLALRYIAYQPRTTLEVRSRLEKAGCEIAAIDEIVRELVEKNHLNDERYAQDWIETRATSKPRSYRFFFYELKRKGVAEDAISQAMHLAPSEKEMAYTLGLKYQARFSHLDEVQFKKKMQGVLARRAFPYDVIRETIDQLIDQRNLEEKIMR